MVKLTTKLVTSIITDTIFVSEVNINFDTKYVNVTLRRGTTDVNGNFVENYPALHIGVNPDGSFSSDSTFNGPAGTIPVAATLAALSGQFDQMVQAVLFLL